MKTYIDRALIIPALTDRYEPKYACYPMTLTLELIAEALLGIPIADVTEVQHGRWEFLGPNRLIKSCMCGTCSVCHVRSVYIVNTAICPNCGATMDKEDEHEAN